MSILTYNEQQAIKAISANNQSKFAQIEKEVEESDLKELLGIYLLQDVQINPTSTYNALLLAGTTYTNSLGLSVKINGLKWMTGFLVFARYVEVSDVADSFTGFVQKTHSEAQIMADGLKRRLIERNREIALQEWEYIKDYLNFNYQNFPLWNKSESKQPYIPKFKGLKRTIL